MSREHVGDGDDWVQTAGGGVAFPLRPRPSDFSDMNMVAYVLAGKERWGSQCRPRYSVAEHCVRISYLVPDEHRMKALLHEPDEIYMPDVPSPVKHAPVMAWYRDLCALHEAAAFECWGLEPGMPQAVKIADSVMLATELRDLMGPLPRPRKLELPPPLEMKIVPWSRELAEERFLARFAQLDGIRRVENLST